MKVLSYVEDNNQFMPDPDKWTPKTAPPLGPFETDTSSPVTLTTVVGQSIVATLGVVDITRKYLLPIEVVLQDIHEMIKGKLKNWKEEEHIAGKMLLQLIKKREE